MADPGAVRLLRPTPAPPAPPAPPDPMALLRSKSFVVILVFAAVVGVVVSLASWAFLELINQIQIGVFTDLPGDLGFNSVPWWWPLPVLFLAGFPVAFAIARLPGNGGHIPANGLQMGTTEPNMLPGVVLAAVATIGLGLVLGPEAPLIAFGRGLGAVHGAAGQEGRAAPDAGRHGGGRRLRRDLGDLRLAARGRDPRDRGRGPGRPHAAADRAARPDGGRDRITRVRRHGRLDRAQHQCVLARPVASRAVLTADASRRSAGPS